MTAAVILSALAMTAIVAVRYLLSSGLFAWLTRRLHPGLYAGLDPQIRREIGWSLASAAIYGVPAGIVAWGWQERGWTLIYTDLAAWPTWYLPVSLLLYLAAHDTWFYWTHRLLHRPAWFRAAHAVHHAVIQHHLREARKIASRRKQPRVARDAAHVLARGIVHQAAQRRRRQRQALGRRDALHQFRGGLKLRFVHPQRQKDLFTRIVRQAHAADTAHDLAAQDEIDIAVDEPLARVCNRLR